MVSREKGARSAIYFWTQPRLIGERKKTVLRRGWETETVTVKISPGVKNDTLLFLSLKGRDASHREDRVYLRVKVARS